MFLTFINFAICFLIVSSSYMPLTNGYDKKTPDEITDSAEVNERLKSFSKYRDILPSDLDKGEFWGKLKMLVSEFVQANRKIQQLCFEKGVLDTEKEHLARYKNLAVVRTRVGQLEMELYPMDQLDSGNRYDRWRVILRATNFHAQQIRRRVEQEYGFENPSDSHHAFATAMQKIYGDINLVENSPHNVVDDRVLEILRTDSDASRTLFALLGVNYEDNNRKALKIIAEPLMLPTNRIKDVSPLEDKNDLRYIVIRPVSKQFETSTIKDTDISKFFQRIPMKVVEITPVQIIVEFKDMATAIIALNTYPPTLNGVIVRGHMSEQPKASTIPE